MGVKPAPAFAIIYVYLTVEKPLLEKDFTYSIAPPDETHPADLMTIDSWDRYVDDCFGVGRGDHEDVARLFKYVNRLNPHIQFTYEANNQSVDFLDLTIHHEEDKEELQWELFIKPTSLGIFLNYNSAHPRSMIMNSARNELLRARRNGSSDIYKERGVAKIRDMLISNSFPPNIVNSLVKETAAADTQIKLKEGNKDLYLCLPFVDEQHKRKTYQILRQNNLLDKVRVTFRPDRSLKDTLTRSALCKTPCNKQSNSKCYDCNSQCMQKNIAYKLTCTLCGAEYCGETGRFKRNRCWEHFKSVRDGTCATAMGKHYSLSHADVARPAEPFKFEILKVCKDFADRMLWQSLYIKQFLPTINTQLSPEIDGWQKNTWMIM